MGLGIAYAPWMASYTESVEARNPALTATCLAIWGWIIRIVVFVSYLLIPVVINTVTPLVNYGGTVSAYPATYPTPIPLPTPPPDGPAPPHKNPPHPHPPPHKIPPPLAAPPPTAAHH